MFEKTIYAVRGEEYEALTLAWRQVEEILGHPHSGSEEDDEALIAYLVKAGAPDWVRTAPGWVDECGWGLYGPKIEE